MSLRDGATDLVKLAADGAVLETTPSTLRLSFPARSPDGRTVACLALEGGRPRLSLPCAEPPTPEAPEAYGPVAFSPDGSVLYYAAPNERGTLDLWSRPLREGRSERLTSFSTDAYAPTVTRRGDVLFKVQDYSVRVATVPATGGAPALLADFQSETPSWHPGGRQIGITYGSWRRFMDDFHYPDIAQDVGVISLDQPASRERPRSGRERDELRRPEPLLVAQRTLHRPALALRSRRTTSFSCRRTSPSRPGRSAREEARRAGRAGRPTDVSSCSRRTRSSAARAARGLPSWERPRERNAIVLIGVDQESGTVREPQREVRPRGVPGQPLHVEWGPDSSHLYFDSNDGGDRRSLNVVSREGGRVTRLHAFESEEGFSGIGLSPDGRWVAFAAPARDGFAQIFVVPSAGDAPVQVTSDPTNKTQPSFSPDGKTIALTLWRYDELFFALERSDPDR